MLSSQRVKAVVNWYKAALSQARAQGLSKVVDGEYMLLNKILCTYDAQAVFCELYAYTLLSTKASMDEAALLSYIISEW